jgi:hypothetical protein
MFLDAVNIFAFIVIGFFVLFSLYFRNHSEG